MIPLLCETTARAPEAASPDFLALITGVLLVVGGLLVKRIVR